MAGELRSSIFTSSLDTSSICLLHSVSTRISKSSTRSFGSAFQDDIAQTDAPAERMLKVPLLFDKVNDQEIEVGLGLMELPAEGAKSAGLVLVPLVPSSLGAGFDITTNLKLQLRAGSDVGNQFGVMLRGSDLEIRYPFRREYKPARSRVWSRPAL